MLPDLLSIKKKFIVVIVLENIDIYLKKIKLYFPRWIKFPRDKLKHSSLCICLVYNKNKVAILVTTKN